METLKATIIIFLAKAITTFYTANMGKPQEKGLLETLEFSHPK
jgi:hypothetical protein